MLSDGSWLAIYQTLSSECPSSFAIHPFYFIGFLCVSGSLPIISGVFFFFLSYFVLLPFLLAFLFLFSLSSFVDVPLIFSCPADHVLLPDWRSRILLSMVDARSVNVDNTHTHTHTHQYHLLPSCLCSQRIFSYLLGSPPSSFYRDASSALLYTSSSKGRVLLNSRFHVFRYGSQDKIKDLILSINRIVLTTPHQ